MFRNRLVLWFALIMTSPPAISAGQPPAKVLPSRILARITEPVDRTTVRLLDDAISKLERKKSNSLSLKIGLNSNPSEPGYM